MRKPLVSPSLLFAACAVLSVAAGPVVPQAASGPDFVPVTDAMLQSPSDDDWLMWRRTLDSWAYSPLDQINRENVGDLALVWARGMTAGIQTGTPLVYNGVLYMPNPKDVIQAIDAVTGDLIWEYRREVPDDIMGYLGALAENNRNLAIYDNLIIDTSVDDYIFALDARTGELVWETQILDYKKKPATQGSGPIIADGRAISGRSCRPLGGPDACVITAHDAKTGKELWRRRTIPAPGEPGNETWGDVPFEERKHVGSWTAASYDPQLELIYMGTSVTSPAPKFLLGGTNLKHLYHNSTLALEVDTGEINWYYQHLNDHWDLDHPFERILVDTAVSPDRNEVPWINPRVQAGEVRKVMTGIPGKTGVVYTIDRETGEFLWATPTVPQNVISNIDGATGAVTENEETVFTELGQTILVCPTYAGGRGPQAGAYSPLTNMIYNPLRNACAQMTSDLAGRLPIYALDATHQMAPGFELLGNVRAVSVETGKTAWIYEQPAATMSIFTSGGGLVFGGDVKGRFRAWDQETGEVLWEVNLGAMVSGYPISYGVDGRQYIVASTGKSVQGMNVEGITPTATTVTGDSSRGLPSRYPNNLFVFALPRSASE